MFFRSLKARKKVTLMHQDLPTVRIISGEAWSPASMAVKPPRRSLAGRTTLLVGLTYLNLLAWGGATVLAAAELV
jgi:hypothetical protein